MRSIDVSIRDSRYQTLVYRAISVNRWNMEIDNISEAKKAAEEIFLKWFELVCFIIKCEDKDLKELTFYKAKIEVDSHSSYLLNIMHIEGNKIPLNKKR